MAHLVMVFRSCWGLDGGVRLGYGTKYLTFSSVFICLDAGKCRCCRVDSGRGGGAEKRDV